MPSQREATWRWLEEARAEGRPVTVSAVSATGAGVVIAIGDVTGFMRRRDLLWGQRGDPAACIGLRFDGLVVSGRHDPQGLLISPRAWAHAQCIAAYRAERRVRGRIVRANAGGLVIDVNGVRGFLPRSRMTNRQHKRYRDSAGRGWRGYVIGFSSHEVTLSTTRPVRSVPVAVERVFRVRGRRRLGHRCQWP